MTSTLNLLNAFERSVKCESDTAFINNWLARLVDPDRTTVLPSMVLESGNVLSNPMLEMTDVKSNVKHLRGFKKYAPTEDAKQKINNFKFIAKASKPMDHGLDYGIEVDNDDFIEVESNFDANDVIEATSENQENILPKKLT